MSNQSSLLNQSTLIHLNNLSCVYLKMGNYSNASYYLSKTMNVNNKLVEMEKNNRASLQSSVGILNTIINIIL
jgi:hypothetical protein